MNKCYKASILLFSGALSLAGCDEQPEPAAKVEVSNVATPKAASAVVAAPVAAPVVVVPTPVVVAPPKPYEATLEEGIDFSKPGYPTFIDTVSGIGMQENWGRLSEGKIVKFKFKKPLPLMFRLELIGGAFGDNIGKAIKINVGSIVKEISFTSDFILTKKVEVKTVLFKLKEASDTIEIIVPAPREPSKDSKDLRKFGLEFVKLKVLN